MTTTTKQQLAGHRLLHVKQGMAVRPTVVQCYNGHGKGRVMCMYCRSVWSIR